MDAFYEIRVEGTLDPSWSDWLYGLSITPTGENETILCGPVADQAALHGILNRIRDMNLRLLSVKIKQQDCPANKDVKPRPDTRL